MRLDELRERLKEIPQADARRLQELKNELLGRKAGALTEILKSLPKLAPAERKAVGGAANALKQELETAFAARERALAHATRAPAGLDRSMPGRETWTGGLHLVTQVVDEICDIFKELGFTRAVQLLQPQFPQGPSGARRAGLVLPGRRHPAAHPHIARADPHARALSTARAGGDSRAGLPP